MKKFIAGMLVGGAIAGILSATTVVLADSNIQATLWPATVSFNVKGTQSFINEGEILNYNNKAYVPLRSFSESIGAEVNYTQPAFSGDKHKVDIVYGDVKDLTLSDPDGLVSVGYLNFKSGGSKTPITGIVKLNKDFQERGGASLRLLLQVYDENNKLVGEFPDIFIPEIQPGEMKSIFSYASRPIDSSVTKYTFKVQVHTETSKTDVGEKSSVSITDNGVKDILNELIPKAVDIYGMFNGTGWFKSDATKTIPGEDGYTFVVDKNVKSVADLKKAVEDVFTKDSAQKEFYNRYLTPEKDRPLYKDYEGQLYQDTHNGGHGWAEKFLIDTAKIKSQKDNVVEIELDTTVLDDPGDKVTIRIENVNGKWLMATGLV